MTITVPNSVNESNVCFVPSQDFVLSVQNVNFVSINTRPPQKKGVSHPVNLKNVSIKDVNFIHSLTYSVSVPPAPVRMSAVSTATVPTMWPPSYHKQGSNLSKDDFLHLGPEAKIQTGTQSESSREAYILKSCCDSCTFCSYRRHVFQGM